MHSVSRLDRGDFPKNEKHRRRSLGNKTRTFCDPPADCIAVRSSHARAVLINRFTTVRFANCDAVRSNPAELGVKIDIPVEV